MNTDGQYARLPDDMIMEMIGDADKIAAKIAEGLDHDAAQYEEARKIMKESGHISNLTPGHQTDSIMCADGAFVVDQKLGVDMLLSLAVGVDGLGMADSEPWPVGARQYQHWQAAVPHHVSNARLAQCITSLMELCILAETDREVRIMDGTHLTFISKVNSLFSSDEEEVGSIFVENLERFLFRYYKKLIPDIPNMLNSAFTDKSVIGVSKYSSSRELIDWVFQNEDIELFHLN